MSKISYNYTPLTSIIEFQAEAWIDDLDVDATIVFGIRNPDGTAITNGTDSITIDTLNKALYRGELDIHELGLVEGDPYDIYAELQTDRVSASPVVGIQNAFMQNVSLSVTINTESDKSFGFSSPANNGDEVFFGGFYEVAASDNDFSPSVNFGTANIAYGAHLFVVLGALTVDELTIRVSGTSITDAAVRTTSDTEDIVIPDATAANAYYETTKKWIGQVAIVVQSGTAKTCNYGFTKYWDFNNNHYTVLGVDFTFFSDANDANTELRLYHHKSTGWTFNAASTPTPPTAIASMQTDYVTEYQVLKGQPGAYKRDDLDVHVLGNDSEGIILSAASNNGKAFLSGNAVVHIRN